MINIEEGLKRIQTKYPQAHILNNPQAESLLVIPSVLLPKGFNKTICTVLTKIPHGFPGTHPNGFWIDFPDLKVKLTPSDVTGRPYYSNNNNIYGYPEWDGHVTYFYWRLQAWNPNKDSLYTWLMAITKGRLKAAR